MVQQGELIDDTGPDFRERFLERVKARHGRVSIPREVDQMLDSGEISVVELRRHARTGLIKAARDILREVNRETGVQDFEPVPGSTEQEWVQLHLMTFDDYAARITELVSDIHSDVARVRARLEYCRRRWQRTPPLPSWFVEAAA